MARVSLARPWWRRMLARWWAVDSVCCLWAQPSPYRLVYVCGWCGRELDWREWAEPIETGRLRVKIDLLRRTVEVVS